MVSRKKKCPSDVHFKSVSIVIGGAFCSSIYSYNVGPPSYVCWFRFAPVTSSL